MLIFLYVYVFISSLFLSLILVPVAKKLALRWNIHDHPGERKIHTEAKPYVVLQFFCLSLLRLCLI